MRDGVNRVTSTRRVIGDVTPGPDEKDGDGGAIACGSTTIADAAAGAARLTSSAASNAPDTSVHL
jgi:hypothetical protein